ncbi:type I-F CRISPR-associated protein Csy2 [Oligella urethralis]|uniref:CRISPR type I-F/YPEST-associated protein Csy2 n=1 Tax=Oligella urethralis TaxID=90245 RepID=A0A2X1UM46_9BURK|nr:type I-F CRISPR-associated protein Csy2 [Oligella urethralis]AVL70690.1 type I-F CRISPR-associated protein Csy2 [Oligella urethralis]SPY08229.1 CRISPR type I-F/YPEST-associated protein Csy2 [Oligella urethralis]SUA55219.1 CRISPR type I-F/YPEST-associated protein Csy2 [Oligella urethralis]SUA67925.1 CRISPR type I-F/YPEST-associated protein Csy2 [Oligella urethralis]
MNDYFYILVDGLKLTNANAISGPQSYGFPALNGFISAAHALERRLKKLADFPDISFDGVLISCRDFKIKMDDSGYFATFNQKRAPILKDGKTAPIIEEGYVDLTVSLVIKATGDQLRLFNLDKNKKTFEEKFRNLCLMQRFAGGSVEYIRAVEFFTAEDTDTLKRRLLPGFVLIDAYEDAANIYHEMVEGYRTEIEEKIDPETGEITRYICPVGHNPETDMLDVLISTAAIYQIPPKAEQSEWTRYSFKRDRGWLVPIPVGYQAITQKYDADQVANIRNPNYASQFVEVIYGLGKWVFPHRLKGDINQYFWRYDNSVENLYLITQHQPSNTNL